MTQTCPANDLRALKENKRRPAKNTGALGGLQQISPAHYNAVSPLKNIQELHKKQSSDQGAFKTKALLSTVGPKGEEKKNPNGMSP